MSAIARVLLEQGYKVSGSDLSESEIVQKLKDLGAKIYKGHSAENIIGVDAIVVSTAIAKSNPEVMAAIDNNIPVYHRSEIVATLLNNEKGIAVAGAHGKSTTTAILATILQSSALIGAISKEFGSNFRYVDKTVAFEADESDASFLLSNPYCAIVTNAEPEHMEYYHYDYDKFYESYETFLSLAKKRVVNGEDKDIQKLKIEDATYLYPSKDIKNLCYTIKNGEPCTKFTLKDYGEFEVWGFGFHIASNASLAILAALNELDIETIRKNLLNYKGIKKRFDIVQSNEKFVVIDDYAHHPTEIEATMKSVELYDNLTNFNNRIVLWQPHKYSRTSDNLEGFKKCFRRCDELIILPLWTVAGEKKIDIDFEKEFASYNPIFADRVVSYKGKIELIKDDKIIKTYDEGIFLGVGAGDITYQLRY